jgi:hypothetical protein
MKILCSGDLHLGRRSSRLPAGVDAGAHSATAAWKALVELAIAERVDLVALSGDLVDRANRYFEAFGPLEAGVRRLTAAGIPTVAVAGNHLRQGDRIRRGTQLVRWPVTLRGSSGFVTLVCPRGTVHRGLALPERSKLSFTVSGRYGHNRLKVRVSPRPGADVTGTTGSIYALCASR